MNGGWEYGVGSRGKIGVEFDHLNIQNYEKLRAFLPESKDPFEDVGLATMQMRMIKSPEEIGVHRQAARAARGFLTHICRKLLK